ncbi:MAG: DUF4990 domain-containing protein [Planctomycetales bacterium]|nr:DUF4990 domain-containing protein [Planctomycetales bacterium]
MIRCTNILLAGTVWAAVVAGPASGMAATFFVAPNGQDENAGTSEAPFASLAHAQRQAAPGDTVYLRSGTYTFSSAHIDRRKYGRALVILLNKSGEPGRRIRYAAYPGERPVFDFSAVRPPNLRVYAFAVTGSWIHLQGIEVVGVQVTVKEHTQSICFANDGSHNVFESLSMHDGQAIGLYSARGGDNLFLNCDAYRNHDYTSDGGKGGNTDGFGCHPHRGDTGNVFRGCRAWLNSDDGFDCISAHEAVTFEQCWSFYNGYSPQFEGLGDGHGFKAGGYGASPQDKFPATIPRHVVRGCLAARNRSSGFYANHHPGGGDWLFNSSYRNPIGFHLLCRTPDAAHDTAGFDHRLHNNLSYADGRAAAAYDAARCELAHNAFALDRRVHAKEFISLDEALLTAPRPADGGLPALTFLRPLATSSLQERGYTYFAAPDSANAQDDSLAPARPPDP